MRVSIKKELLTFVLGASAILAIGAGISKISLMINESTGECSQSVNFTGTTTLNSAAIATQAYSDGLVSTHNVNASAHPDKLKASNNLSDLPSVSTARTNLGLKSAAILDAGTGVNNVPQLDASGKLLSSIFPASGVTAGTYGSGTLVPVIIVDSTGRITGISTVSVSGGSWGTITGTLANQTDLQTALNARIPAPDSPAAGDIIYYSGSAWVRLAKGTDGQALILSSGLPAWLTASGLGDMLASVYDPTSKGADAFDMDNMTEGSTNLILSSTERTNISNAASHVSSTSNPHGVTLNQAATGGASTTVDVTVGNDFKVGDGTDTDKTIYANNGDASLPAIKYNHTDNKWQYSNDGSTYNDMGSGSGGSGAWGDITGTITDQDDLVEYIAERALRDSDIASSSGASNNGQPLMRYVGDSGIDSNTVFCAHFDETDAAFTDSSSYARTITNSGATYSASGKFSGCGVFNDDYLSVPYSASLNFGTGDFTIDWWATIDDLHNAATLIGQNATGYMILHLVNSTLKLGLGNGGYQTEIDLGVTADSTLHHYAVSRVSGVVYMFLDGVLKGSGSNTTSYNFDSSQAIYMGQQSATAGHNPWRGKIDELRISKGIGRYTSNFTPPASAYASSVMDNRLSSSKSAQNIASRTATTPTIAAGTGAGTSPTVSIAGTDNAGQITVTTGTSPTAAGTIATVTFASTYLNTPYVVISPANANAAALYNTTRVYATSSTSAITLTAGSAALTASTQYIWNYHAF